MYVLNFYSILYTLDNTTNCVPSLHVALSCIAAFGIWYERQQIWQFMAIWAVLIIISTMTTKQHQFIDVITGIILFITCLFMTRKVAREKRL